MVDNDFWVQAGETFAAISAVCGLLSRLFAAPPDEELVDTLRALDSEETMLLNDQDPDWTEGLGLLAGFWRGANVQERLVNVIGDHSRLFVGPTHVQAPPWGSVYMDRGLLQGPSTQRVVAAYRQAGLQPPNPQQEPPDHITVELDFVSELDRRLAGALAVPDLQAASQHLTTLDEFLRDHLLPWLELFLQRVEKLAQTDFYRGLARLSRSAVALQQQFVALLAAELKAQDAAGE